VVKTWYTYTSPNTATLLVETEWYIWLNGINFSQRVWVIIFLLFFLSIVLMFWSLTRLFIVRTILSLSVNLGSNTVIDIFDILLPLVSSTNKRKNQPKIAKGKQKSKIYDSKINKYVFVNFRRTFILFYSLCRFSKNITNHIQDEMFESKPF